MEEKEVVEEVEEVEEKEVTKPIKRKTRIISGFAGTGKSWCFEHLPELLIKDSDSSQFNRDNFPQNYVNDIKFNLESGEWDVIFISAHREVREALMAEYIHYDYVLPDVSLKEVYLNRYKERNSPQAFIDLMEKNWDTFTNVEEELESYGRSINASFVTVTKLTEEDQNMESFLNTIFNKEFKRRESLNGFSVPTETGKDGKDYLVYPFSDRNRATNNIRMEKKDIIQGLSNLKIESEVCYKRGSLIGYFHSVQYLENKVSLRFMKSLPTVADFVNGRVDKDLIILTFSWDELFSIENNIIKLSDDKNLIFSLT